MSNMWALIAATSNYDIIVTGKMQNIREAIEGYSLPTWWFIGIFIVWLYLLFLYSFPYWLLEGEHQEKQNARPEVDANTDAGSNKE